MSRRSTRHTTSLVTRSHRRATSIIRRRERRFFHEVAQALDGANGTLVVGPSTAKLHFLNYVHKNAQTLEPRIVGIETVDHPTDRQLAAYVRQYFVDADGAPSPAH